VDAEKRILLKNPVSNSVKPNRVDLDNTLEKEASIMSFFIGLGIGVVVGGLLVIVFNHIAAVRSEVVETYNNAEAAVEAKVKKKK